MKSFAKLAASAAVLVSLAVAAFGIAPLVAADGTGQIEAGSGVYEVKDLTSNGAYGNSINANACDELEYSVRLHNSGYVAVNNIEVAATLSSAASTTNTSTVNITYTDGVVPSTTASATVTLPSAQSISYETGTTTLYDGNGNMVKTMPDGITGQGISLGSLNGSTTEYVNFKAKVNCPAPTCPSGTTGTYPNCEKPTCPSGTTGTYPNCETPKTPPTTTTTSSTPTPPAQLVNTGAGDVVALFAAAVAVGTVGYRVFLGRRLSRQ